MPSHLTPAQVAARLGCHVENIYRAIQRGTLTATRRTVLGHTHYGITPEDADDWGARRAELQRQGRPKGEGA